MSDYGSYVAALTALVGAREAADEHTRGAEERSRVSTDNAQRDYTAATVRITRMREEVDRQLARAQKALNAVGRPDLLRAEPVPVLPEPPAGSADAQVTASVRALQRAVDVLVGSATASAGASVRTRSAGPGRWWIALAGTIVVGLIVVFVAFLVGNH